MAAVLTAPPALADDPRPETNDFILRAPAAEIDGIAARVGLEIVTQVATAPDAEGNSLYLVRAPDGAPPALIIGDVEDGEPAAAAIEAVVLASIPETDEEADLTQRTMAILGALAEAQRFDPPTSVLDSGWNGPLADRRIEAGRDAKLKLETEHEGISDPRAYAVTVEFAEGCSVALVPGELDATLEVGAPDFDGKKVTWEVTHSGGETVRIERIAAAWPAANEELKKVRLDGREIYNREQPPAEAVIESGWKDLDHPEHRELGPGATLELRVEFDKDAALDPTRYALELGAATAGVQITGGCNLEADGALRLDGRKVEWEIDNNGATDLTVERLSLVWPTDSGRLVKVELEGKKLVLPSAAPYSLHGEDADGEKRSLWSEYVDQPATELLRVKEAHGKLKGHAVVAIIDSGVDPEHPLFAHRLLPGYDFLRDQQSASEWEDLLDQETRAILGQRTMAILGGDDVVEINPSTAAILDGDDDAEIDPADVPPAFGHGTMVAGIVHLVAPGARILPLKAFDGHGRGNLFDIVEAIYYAVDHGANVINMSFSLDTFSPELMRAVNYAARRGVACVAAAGNDGGEAMVYPAAFGNTLGVAATAADDTLSPFSNHGSDLVTISAPGEELLTSYPGGGWALASGTSFAAPWISGAVALFADKNGRGGEPGRADTYLAAEALSHAVPLAGQGRGRVGHGRADLKAAVDKLRGGFVEADLPPGIYSIAVELAEGCTVLYPPAATGSGCDAYPASQLSFSGKKLEWEITNLGAEAITVERITVEWPAENGDLERVKIGGAEIFKDRRPPAATEIDSGWEGHLEKRQIEPGETEELRLEFKDAAVSS